MALVLTGGYGFPACLPSSIPPGGTLVLSDSQGLYGGVGLITRAPSLLTQVQVVQGDGGRHGGEDRQPGVQGWGVGVGDTGSSICDYPTVSCVSEKAAISES